MLREPQSLQVQIDLLLEGPNLRHLRGLQPALPEITDENLPEPLRRPKPLLLPVQRAKLPKFVAHERAHRANRQKARLLQKGQLQIGENPTRLNLPE